MPLRPWDRCRSNPRACMVSAALAAGICACAAYGAVFLLRNQKAEFLASRLDYMAVIADLKADSIREFHRERVSDLAFYSTDPHLIAEYREKLRGGASPSNDVTATFAALINRGLYSRVQLLNRHGRVILDVPADGRMIEPSRGPAAGPRLLGLRRSDDGTAALDYEVGTADGARLLFRVRRVTWLAPLIERWPGAEKTAEVLIFEKTGDVLTALNEPRHANKAALPLRIPLDSGLIAARAAAGETGSIAGRDYRGERCYAVARRFPELGWILVVKADEAELLSPMREKLLMHLFAVFGVSALLGAVLLVVFRAQGERLRAAAESERRLLSTAIEQAGESGESIVITDHNAVVIYTNPAFTRASGYSREEANGKNVSILKSGRHDRSFYKTMWETLGRGDIWNGKLVNRRKDGSLFDEEASITPVRDAAGQVSHYIAVKRDVSAVKALEDQLYHSQKMEAIGRLAGGVAHDFNNILTTINGYAEILADAAPPDSQASSDLAEILGAGRRAALLTRQLLTFSRRAPADPVVVDLRGVIRAMEKMLHRTLGEDVRFSLDLPGEPLWVKTDPGQVDQVLMNLSVNARDAMPRGGTLSVRVHAAEFESDEVRALEVIPAGRYAALVVGDDGAGMSGEVLAHIFEPFFTTKEKGKGTGLGLSTVFGIVKQNKGHITVDSEPGRGSTFTVYFPFVAAPAAAADPESAPAPAPASLRGDETVLVVEDQPEVLRLVSRALTPQGYRVLPFSSAADALAAAGALEGPIHLLLTDVVMPAMGGELLAGRMRLLRPETKVLFMSGYTDGRLDRLTEAGEKADLLLKPFTADQVCRRVRDALDGTPARMG